MVYLFYIIIFIVVGIIIGLIFRNEEEKAYTAIIVITIGWAFVWGIWAIAAFIELAIGFAIAQSMSSSSSNTYSSQYPSIETLEDDFISKVKFNLEVLFGMLKGIVVFFIVLGFIAFLIYAYFTKNNIKEVEYLSPKEKCIKAGNEWRSETSQCIKLYSLNIQTNPSNARVRIMNIKSKYYDGIKLEPGRYTITVDRSGYYPENFYINLYSDGKYSSVLKPKW